MYWIRMLKNVIDGPFYTALARGDVGCCGVRRALSWFTVHRGLRRAARPANCALWVAAVLLTVATMGAMAAGDGAVAQSQASQADLKSQELFKSQELSQSQQRSESQGRSQRQELSQTQELTQTQERATAQQDGQPTRVFFGDTHLHTSYSFDAYLNENRSADPETAYRWARGYPVIHPYNRVRAQISTPLDFLVVADHAEMLGLMRALHTDQATLPDLGVFGNIWRWLSIKRLNRAIDDSEGLAFFGRFLPPSAAGNEGSDPVADANNNIDEVAIFGDTSATVKDTWSAMIDAAERHNQPGEFTTLLGWEWSSVPTGANLHRVVVTPDGADVARQYVPYGSDQSQYPEDLWSWLEATSERTGGRFIAIPHNSNISKGYMFAETTVAGVAIDADYSRRRMRWEPIVEVTQIKGDSETRSRFSPDDPFAEFETFAHYIQTDKDRFVDYPGDYVRPALKMGLSLGRKTGVNPFKFGLIGSSDSHSGLAAVEEDNFWGKMARDSTPEQKTRRVDSPVTFDGWDMSASGLAAVWAEDNTREALFAAFQRKEVYATTGPRLRVQLFASWDFPNDAASSRSFAEIGYRHGVPMGADLVAPATLGATSAPQFLVRAVKDPRGANLDRVQIVKGWVDNAGRSHEHVYNVAWSDDRVVNARGRLPAVGNSVDLSRAVYSNTIGAAELSVRWIDPHFDPAHRAFYYARVLQIPTPRNGLLDALALGLSAPPRGPSTLQERAYTSPIWYQP